jgi:hypothetical protein
MGSDQVLFGRCRVTLKKKALVLLLLGVVHKVMARSVHGSVVLTGLLLGSLLLLAVAASGLESLHHEEEGLDQASEASVEGVASQFPTRKSTTPPETQVQAVQGLIGRLLGASYVPLFHLSISPTPQEDESSTSDHDFYTLSTTTYTRPPP